VDRREVSNGAINIIQQRNDSDNQAPRAPETHKYVFRGDDDYKGGTVGKAYGAEADAAEIQNFADHVLRKESKVTSRFTSFTTEMKIAIKFTKAADVRRVSKAELTKLRNLESQGTIRIWNPDQVFDAAQNSPRKLARQAGDVRAAMRRNSEILIEGQIPPGILIPVTP
jgi:hypothetical protein